MLASSTLLKTNAHGSQEAAGAITWRLDRGGPPRTGVRGEPLPLNSADDWLHFVLGVGMIGLGVALSRYVRTSRSGRV